MVEHSSFVNSCCPSRRGPLVVSGSDDGTDMLWDVRQKGAIQTFPDKYQITAASFSDASDKIYTAGIDDLVKVWDIRRNEVTMTLQGHQGMIIDMQLSPNESPWQNLLMPSQKSLPKNANITKKTSKKDILVALIPEVGKHADALMDQIKKKANPKV